MGIVDYNMSKADMQGTAILPGELLCRSPKTVPLVVDLDGTLIRSDVLIKSASAHLDRIPCVSVVFIGIGAWQSSAEGAARGKDGNRCIPSAI